MRTVSLERFCSKRVPEETVDMPGVLIFIKYCSGCTGEGCFCKVILQAVINGGEFGARKSGLCIEKIIHR